MQSTLQPLQHPCTAHFHQGAHSPRQADCGAQSSAQEHSTPAGRGCQVRYEEKQQQPVPMAGTSSGPCPSSLHSRKLPETTSYSLELFHKCPMVSYVLPEAFENGADVVADCKLVIELASGSGMFHICKTEQSPKLSHQGSLPTPLSLLPPV